MLLAPVMSAGDVLYYKGCSLFITTWTTMEFEDRCHAMESLLRNESADLSCLWPNTVKWQRRTGSPVTMLWIQIGWIYCGRPFRKNPSKQKWRADLSVQRDLWIWDQITPTFPVVQLATHCSSSSSLHFLYILSSLLPNVARKRKAKKSNWQRLWKHLVTRVKLQKSVYFQKNTGLN